MAGDIIPIELGLTRGDFVTLWAPEWHEGDDEWEAFLGHEEDLYAFEAVAHLAAFIRNDNDNDLVDHPSWKVVAALAANELEPDDLHRFDLVGVPELVADDPDADTLAELAATFEMVQTIGDVCEISSVTAFFAGNPHLGSVGIGVDAYVGKDGQNLWDRIGASVSKSWDDVIDAIDSVVTTPDVDASAVDIAEAELLAAAENVVDVDDVSDEDEDVEDNSEDEDEETPDPIADAAADENFWVTVGIDPVRIITSEDTYYTLRCYIDDEPIFLGRTGSITVFGSERSLARYLADDHDHDLAKVSTYAEVQTAAIDGSLKIEITDDNVYVLPGLADDLAVGPTAVDADQLDLAVELFTDAADFADDDTVETALAASTPLGWYVSYTLEPDPNRLAPSAPFEVEAEAWRALERDFEARLRKN
ncbi:primosomal protein [Rhodococcus sp. G-MC3]|uniref:primosomal protein n=1 Tax=Rhodococcus sp. G-MC3 TaxID=3046209 RepID=UPI0024B905BE|nr:primosomal protein [Rhodococcus sp. G-MC3]MDJ0395920.1 primosomal protein [Rhodococcus sp. G-MC3]